jgi:hypothetical protein
MIKVASVERIRWAHFRDGQSIRVVAKAFHVSRKTVRRPPGPSPAPGGDGPGGRGGWALVAG